MENSTKKRVLCIEDDTEIIDLVQLILTRHGYDVIKAEGGAEGLQLVEEIHPDVILLDLMMPDIDGWEVYQKVRANPKSRDIPVIVLTAKAQSADRMLGLHIAKVDAYITKPFSPAELLSSLSKVMSHTT